MTIMQGDRFSLPIRITLGDQTLTDAEVAELRFTLGEIVKSYPGEITYDADHFYAPLEQEETFALPAGAATLVVRVKLKNNAIRGYTTSATISVQHSNDREVF